MLTAETLMEEQMTTGHEERTLVVGLGKTGLSVARFLAARGESVAVTDSRKTPPMLDELREQLPDVALFTGEFSEQLFATAERIIVSPGVDLRQPPLSEAMMRGAEVMGDIELFARYADAPVVAITGSNGKSTVTALVGAMVEAAGREVRLGGNYGTPALDLLQEQAPDLYVLELSSFQLETTNSLQCESAAVLNISADHMDRYNDLEAYISAKRRIFHNAAVCVVNCDDMAVTAMARGEENVVCFTLRPPRSGEYGLLEAEGEQWLCYGDQCLMAAAELRMVGSHNCANVLAAMALGSAAGLALEPMVEAARHFTGLPHRCQWVAEAEGVRWFNDSKGTNVGATIAAIEGIAAPVVLIAGGEGKGADFAPLREALADKGRAVVLFGRDASLIESAINSATDVVHAANLDEAVAKAAALAKSGDAVLFSPACASFDMFRNYEERGERFVEAVGRLLA